MAKDESVTPHNANKKNEGKDSNLDASLDNDINNEFQNLTASEKIRRRHFNDQEREALYIAAGGLCTICGTQLDAHWEPDHIIPFHAGGITDVSNGAATCRHCNRVKGGRHE